MMGGKCIVTAVQFESHSLLQNAKKLGAIDVSLTAQICQRGEDVDSGGCGGPQRGAGYMSSLFNFVLN